MDQTSLKAIKALQEIMSSADACLFIDTIDEYKRSVFLQVQLKERMKRATKAAFKNDHKRVVDLVIQMINEASKERQSIEN